MRTGARSRLGGWSATAALLASMVTVAGGVSATSAAAGTPGSDPGNGSWVGGKVLDPGGEQLVLWKAPGTDGRLGTCITAGANGPLRGPFTVGSTINDAVYAELNYLYARSSTSDVRLAELSALNAHKYDEADKDLKYSYVRNGQGGTSVADANAMLDRAEDLAGPYKVTISGLVQHGQGDRAGVTYTGRVHVASDNGTDVPDQDVDLTASGAALADRSVTTNANGDANFRYSVPPSSTTGSFTIGYSTDVHLRLDRLTSTAEQTLLATGTPTAVTGRAAGGIDPTISVSWLKYTAGDTAKTPVAGAVFSKVVDATTGRTIATNLTSQARPSTLNQVTAGHTLVWTETKAPAGDYITGPITTKVPANARNGYAIGLANPKRPALAITTAVQHPQLRPGVRLVDNATVTGNDGEAGTITDRLYMVPVPSASSDGSRSCTSITDAQYRAGRLVGVYTGQLQPGNGRQGNGVYAITGPIPSAEGCYHWFESVTVRPSGVTVTGPPNTTTETTLVYTPRPPSTTVNTNRPPTTLVSAGYAGTGTGRSWTGIGGGVALTALGLLLAAGLVLRTRRRRTGPTGLAS